MRIYRLVSALLMLQERGCMLGVELARELKVSERTVRRDMEALRSAGVPVYEPDEVETSWRLDEQWRTQARDLDEVELRALLIAQTRAIGKTQRAASAAGGLDRLMSALPETMRERALSIRQRIYVDCTGWNGSTENLAMLPVVQDAVSLDRKLAMVYWRQGRERVERVVDPLGLVAKGSTWYLVALTPDGFRTYRVSRIEEARMLDAASERPEDFELAEHWKLSTARFQDEVTRAVETNRKANAERLEAERTAAQEMEIARQVQARLFPQTLPPISSLEYAGVCVQARKVGGDYYDFLDLGSDRLGIVIGDIAGKGIAAALLMANLQANLRSQCAIAVTQPQHFLQSVNRLFYENTHEAAYATLFFGEYEDGTQRLRYASCGHLAALLVRGNGTLERLCSTGTVLGLFQDWDCSISECCLYPGDTLALYTDGVTEACNEADEEFGEERLVETLRSKCHLDAHPLLAAIVNEVQLFSPREQQDDITVLVAKCR